MASGFCSVFSVFRVAWSLGDPNRCLVAFGGESSRRQHQATNPGEEVRHDTADDLNPAWP